MRNVLLEDSFLTRGKRQLGNMGYCASLKVELSLFARKSEIKQTMLKFASFLGDSRCLVRLDFP